MPPRPGPQRKSALSGPSGASSAVLLLGVMAVAGLEVGVKHLCQQTLGVQDQVAGFTHGAQSAGGLHTPVRMLAHQPIAVGNAQAQPCCPDRGQIWQIVRSEEHTSELQSRENL